MEKQQEEGEEEAKRSKLLVSVLCSLFWAPAVASKLKFAWGRTWNSITRYDTSYRLPKSLIWDISISWTFMDAAILSHSSSSTILYFLPLKMNDWRFFNVMYRKTSFFCYVWFQSFSSTRGAMAAKKRRKKYLYLLIEIRSKKKGWMVCVVDSSNQHAKPLEVWTSLV